MKKRILTMLLALAMILSVVPMMAMAEELHTHDWSSWNEFEGKCNRGCYTCGTVEQHTPDWWTYDLGNGTHQMKCKVCGRAHSDPVAHTYDNGVCTGCSAKQVCAHSWWTVDLGNGTHQQQCLVCGEPHPQYGQIEPHEFENGRCIDCSAVEACNHNWYTIDLQDGTHQLKCTLCGTAHPTNGQVEPHEFDEDTGRCIDCSALKPSTACDHVGAQNTVDNKDGKTHKVVCPKCGVTITEKAEHVFAADTGKCDCGAVQGANAPAVKPGSSSKYDNVPKTGDFFAMIIAYILEAF